MLHVSNLVPMAVNLPQQGPIQVANVYYHDFFADVSNDPFNREYTNALLPY